MGLVAAIILSFVAAIGINHHNAHHEKKVNHTKVQVVKTQSAKKQTKRIVRSAKQKIALMDGIEVANLRG